MDTTSHKPYVRYEDGETLPVYAFRQSSRGTVPLVAEGNSLVEAQYYREAEYEILTKAAVVDFENGEVKKASSKEVLHG